MSAPQPKDERIHAASAELASEATHIDAEVKGTKLDTPGVPSDGPDPAGELQLFHDVVEQEPMDLWIGNEAWKIDDSCIETE